MEEGEIKLSKFVALFVSWKFYDNLYHLLSESWNEIILELRDVGNIIKIVIVACDPVFLRQLRIRDMDISNKSTNQWQI